MKHRYSSRLRRVERKKSLKTTFWLLVFSLAMILLLIVLGIPLLVRLASFLSELRSPQENIETTTIPPQPPIFEATNMATFSSQIDIRGFSESGSTVVLDVNDNKKEAVTDNEGKFLFENINLNEGENRVAAKAVNQGGGESQESKILLIIYDKTAPKLELELPGDLETTSQEKIIVKGVTETDAVLTVGDRQVILGTDGSFEYPLRLSEGENKVIVVAADLAGNLTKIERTVILKKS